MDNKTVAQRPRAGIWAGISRARLPDELTRAERERMWTSSVLVGGNATDDELESLATAHAVRLAPRGAPYASERVLRRGVHARRRRRRAAARRMLTDTGDDPDPPAPRARDVERLRDVLDANARHVVIVQALRGITRCQAAESALEHLRCGLFATRCEANFAIRTIWACGNSMGVPACFIEISVRNFERSMRRRLSRLPAHRRERSGT